MGHPTVYPTGVTVHDPTRAFAGYTLFQAPGVGALLVDMNGREVQLWKGPSPIAATRSCSCTRTSAIPASPTTRCSTTRS